MSEILPFVNGSDTELAVPARISSYEHRLLLTCSNSSQWFYSNIITTDEVVFQSDAFYSTETRSDKTKAIIGLSNIFALGSNSIETWTSTGGSGPYDGVVDDGPYGTNTNGSILFGVKYESAISILGNDLYFIAYGQGFEDYIIQLNAGGYEVLTTPEQQRIIKQHVFYKSFVCKTLGAPCICFKAYDGFVFCYNSLTKTFSELSDFKDVSDSFLDEYILTDQGIAKLDENITSETIKEIKLPIVPGMNRFILRELDLHYSLVGLKDVVATNNQIFVSCSRNGGSNWTEERTYTTNQNTGTIKMFSFGFMNTSCQIRIRTTHSRPIQFDNITLKIEATDQ
jgi:hypothetical protein